MIVNEGLNMRLVIAFVLLSLVHGMAFAAGEFQQFAVEDVTIMKISARDERAVIKTPDGKMHIVRPGDSIGNKGMVVEIAKDRVVIEEVTEKEQETVILRLEGGKQTVQRYRKVGEGRTELYMPGQPPAGMGRNP